MNYPISVDKHKMRSVFQSCLELLSRDGKFLIYQLSKDSFYYDWQVNVWNLIYENCPKNNRNKNDEPINCLG